MNRSDWLKLPGVFYSWEFADVIRPTKVGERGEDFFVIEWGIDTEGQHPYGDTGLPGEVAQDVGIPRVLNQEAASAAVGCLNWLADPESEVPDAVGSIRSAEIREVTLKRHLQIGDLHAGTASVSEHAGGWLDNGLSRRDRHARSGEHTSLGHEIVLHVDDDDRGLGRIDRQRSRSRVNLNSASYPAHQRWLPDSQPSRYRIGSGAGNPAYASSASVVSTSTPAP